MKIEMCEQLACAWLRYVEGCRMVQLNWSPSPDELLYADHAGIDELLRACREELGEEDYAKARGRSGRQQFLKQCEVDVAGIRLEGRNVEKVYLVDTAFHSQGLGYGDNEARVSKKILRAALVAAVVFPGSPLHIVFASPKVSPGDEAALGHLADVMRSLLARLGMEVELSLFLNDGFVSEMFEPLVARCSEIADGSMLFMRALQLCELCHAIPDGEEAAAGGSAEPAARTKISRRAPRGSNKREVRAVVSSLLGEEGRVLPPLDLAQLTSPEYAGEKFSLSGFPLLAPADEISLKDNRRFYPEPIEIQGRAYRICSQWIPERMQRLRQWYERVKSLGK